MRGPAVTTTAQPIPMTGAEAIVASLEALGVTDVFGMPGGAILPTYDPLMSSKLTTSSSAMNRGPGTPPRGTPWRPAGSGAPW